MSFLTIPTERRLTILLADDDEDDLLLINRAAGRIKIIGKLICVSAGEQVISYLEGCNDHADRQEQTLPDVLVLDHFMPRWSGLDVLLWIRSSRRFERLPVVILSLGLSPAQTEVARLLRAACCPKTAQLEELPAALVGAAHLIQSAGPTIRATVSASSPSVLAHKSH